MSTAIHSRPFDTLISAEQLATALKSNLAPVIFDCSFDLTDMEAGRRSYEAGHLPGARYLHLEQDLSGAKSGRNGRHPLPDRADFVARIGALGLHDDSQVVAYDNAGGMYAARLWWMLRWVGHRAAAVLDGGLPAWQAKGMPLATDIPLATTVGSFSARAPLTELLQFEDVRANVEQPSRLILDARAPDRFRGENETLDPLGGHIPGARNRFFRDNLEADGYFKSADDLRRDFDAVTAARHAADLIAQCGSGVTACHNLLAMEIAGLRGAALYAGSWSEWCTQPNAPIATGAS